MDNRRVFLIVLDSLGIGAMPDANRYGDEGSNTLKSLYQSKMLHVPTMREMGLFDIDGVKEWALPEKGTTRHSAAIARMTEQSAGKDTTTGHWEIAGIISKKPFPTYPDGFPEEVVQAVRSMTGRDVLCNRPYSGTQVILDYGQKQLATGALIVYTSSDSVFQIAAHEDVIPLEELYEICRKVRAYLSGEHAVGRVIARPFKGKYPDFVRTSGRHDYSLNPPEPNLLTSLKNAGKQVIAVGKIKDIFAGSGISAHEPTAGNREGMKRLEELAKKDFDGLVFANLVDFDMLYGHRNDVIGYTKALNEFDGWLGSFLRSLHENDIVMITGDHGCDPATSSTDHSREYTPLLIWGEKIAPVNLHTRPAFADIGATIAELLDVQADIAGKSILPDGLLKGVPHAGA